MLRYFGQRQVEVAALGRSLAAEAQAPSGRYLAQGEVQRALRLYLPDERLSPMVLTQHASPSRMQLGKKAQDAARSSTSPDKLQDDAGSVQERGIVRSALISEIQRVLDGPLAKAAPVGMFDVAPKGKISIERVGAEAAAAAAAAWQQPAMQGTPEMRSAGQARTMPELPILEEEIPRSVSESSQSKKTLQVAELVAPSSKMITERAFAKLQGVLSFGAAPRVSSEPMHVDVPVSFAMAQAQTLPDLPQVQEEGDDDDEEEAARVYLSEGVPAWFLPRSQQETRAPQQTWRTLEDVGHGELPMGDAFGVPSIAGQLMAGAQFPMKGAPRGTKPQQAPVFSLPFAEPGAPPTIQKFSPPLRGKGGAVGLQPPLNNHPAGVRSADDLPQWRSGKKATQARASRVENLPGYRKPGLQPPTLAGKASGEGPEQPKSKASSLRVTGVEHLPGYRTPGVWTVEKKDDSSAGASKPETSQADERFANNRAANRASSTGSSQRRPGSAMSDVGGESPGTMDFKEAGARGKPSNLGIPQHWQQARSEGNLPQMYFDEELTVANLSGERLSL